MKKPNSKQPAEYRIIADSSYIILPDQKVARLLRPTLRNGVVYYNLFLADDKGEPSYTRLSLDDIEATIAKGTVAKSE